jgi:uncharacterized protein YbjT (DUF2867 family)
VTSADQNVLLVGATGKLGRLIARNLLGRGLEVTALLRPRAGRQQLSADLMSAPNLRVVAGDISQPAESLANALAGVEAVVSAVSGGAEVVVAGQRNLIRAAGIAGVKRMIPSDFCLDLHEVEYGVDDQLDLRKDADAEFFGRSVLWNPVLVGTFAEQVLATRYPLIDWTRDTFSYWGEPDVVADYTTIADTAAIVAATIADPGLAGRTVRVSGARLSVGDLHGLVERASGRPFKLMRRGSLDDLRRQLDAMRLDGQASHEYMGLQRHLCQQSGKGLLGPLDNDRFADLTPTPPDQFLEEILRDKARSKLPAVSA